MVFFFVMRQDNKRTEGVYIGRKKGVERMKNIDLLVEEHDCILKLVESIEEAAFQMYEIHQVPVEDLRLIIDCIRTYADNLHHQKEERMLFEPMLEILGDVGEKLVRYGMNVEHDLARFYVRSLEEALDAYEINPTGKGVLQIIGHAMEYANLLRRHVDKENRVVFPFAVRELPGDVYEKVLKNMNGFQTENQTLIQEKLKQICYLHQKYVESQK